LTECAELPEQVASAITHALLGASLGVLARDACRSKHPDLPASLPGDRRASATRHLPLVCALLSALPDADVATHLWFAYSDPLGHRGAFHSLAFYAMLASCVAALPQFDTQRLRAGLGAFAAMASHSLLDMLTNGGLGIALWWPLSDERLFFAWRPIPVSPLSPARFFTGRGLTILAGEAPFVVPVVTAVWWWKWRRQAPVDDVESIRPDDSERSLAPDRASYAGASDEPAILEITDELDLHGFAPRDVLDVVDAYLEAAWEKGLTEVRLIHGRGKGVQRAAVQRLLGGHELVVEYRDAPPGRGGWGATIAWLRGPATSPPDSERSQGSATNEDDNP